MAPKQLAAKSREEYTVGWICPLQKEQTAAIMMLDARHKSLANEHGDTNVYTYGSIGDHNVVIAGLPGSTGTSPATSVAIKMSRSFRNMRIGLLVGIGGGVPSQRGDIRLGDVVISKPDGTSGGVIWWDHGKRTGDGSYKRTGSLNQPPLNLLGAAQKLGSMLELGEAEFMDNIAAALPAYQRPTDQPDNLYKPEYTHANPELSCTECQCDPTQIVPRKPRADTMPKVHQGVIASGNTVMENGVERDSIAHDLEKILCFEMEAAGLMNDFACLIVRGISGYSDSHKNDYWQEYAAATAAACAKDILQYVAPEEIEATQPLMKAMTSSNAQLQASESSPLSANSGFSLLILVNKHWKRLKNHLRSMRRFV